MEFMAQITLNGKPSQCQTAILVSGKKDSEGHYSSLLGKIVDIDENYKRIQMYDAEAAKPALQKQVLLPHSGEWRKCDSDCGEAGWPCAAGISDDV